MKALHKFTLPLILAITLLVTSNIQWGGDKWKDIMEADGRGYYAYLPAFFIYNDPGFAFYDSVETKVTDPHLLSDYRRNSGEGTANKFFVGTGVAMSPFFLGAHLYELLSGGKANGYTKAYSVTINVAAVFYFLLGLYFLKKFLRRKGASEGQISFILILVAFGTNAFYYAAIEPAMSHIYSFAFITMFIYYLDDLFQNRQTKHLYMLTFLLGMIVLIRPQNGMIILLVPFIAGELSILKEAIALLKKNGKITLLSALIFFGIVFIQMLIYKIQTGNFWVDSYTGESFEFLHPNPIDFLFSYKKGLFIYTPVCFVALLGIVYLFRNNRFRFYCLTIFLLTTLYVLSSWWNWWYGGSFSSRVCIEYYAILGLLLYYSFELLKNKMLRITTYCLLGLLILVCQVQTYQYRYYFIHWEKMDKEHYWNVFMRVDLIGKENPNQDLLN